jgi:hypothetical protein
MSADATDGGQAVREKRLTSSLPVSAAADSDLQVRPGDRRACMTAVVGRVGSLVGGPGAGDGAGSGP